MKINKLFIFFLGVLFAPLSVSAQASISWENIDDDDCSNLVIFTSKSAHVENALLAAGASPTNLACSATSFTDSTASPSTTYYFSLFIKDKIGGFTGPLKMSTTTPTVSQSGSNTSSGGGGGGGSGSNTVVTTSPSSGGGSFSGGGGGGSASGRPSTTNTNSSSIGVSNAINSMPPISRNLSYGSEGQDVKYLQVFLISKGYLAPGNDVGFYGKLTEAGVKAFQRTESIASSGSPSTTGYGAVGPLTRARILAYLGVSTSANQRDTSVGSVASSDSLKTNITRNLSYGSQGSDVTYLQNFLISKGYLAPGNAIGFFGRLTEAAVKRFQAEQGIVSSGDPQTTGYGNVGPSTRARINTLSQ